MKRVIIWVFSRLMTVLILMISLPLMFAYTLISAFWKIFGATVIAFIIIGLFGGTLEECMKYSSSLGFFVGVYLTYRERSKE